ncbi:IclR family transcriptional regulator domain-containing protein [Devosia algicola]|uniref:IclR family transcriptional regulator domain-containing protein n=1 Tax=Devosia algicola TaxID=3026418 RepID=UPI002E23FD99
MEAEQACHLVIHDRGHLVVVAQMDGPGYWNVSIRIGSRVGLVNTGSGHIFLAYHSDEEAKLMLEEQGFTDPNALPKGLDQRLTTVRKLGYENMPSAQVSGVFNLSVPIFGPLGSVIAALTCPYTQRIDKANAPNITEALTMLQAAGHELSQRSSEKSK